MNEKRNSRGADNKNEIKKIKVNMKKMKIKSSKVKKRK